MLCINHCVNYKGYRSSGDADRCSAPEVNIRLLWNLWGRFNGRFKSSVMLFPVVTDVSEDRTALFSVNIPRRVNQTEFLVPELESDIFRLNDCNCVPLDTRNVKILESSISHVVRTSNLVFISFV
jgi:hypothetical protein